MKRPTASIRLLGALSTAILFGLALAGSSTPASATVQLSLTTLPTTNLEFSYSPAGTTSGYAWRNDATNGRRDVGESFLATENFTLDTFGVMLQGNIQSGDAGAAVTVSVYKSSSASSIGTLVTSEGGTFPTFTGGANQWLSFDLTDVAITSGFYYTVMLGFDTVGTSRTLALDTFATGTFTGGNAWQTTDGTTFTAQGSDLFFYVQAAVAVPEPATTSLLGLAFAMAAGVVWVRRARQGALPASSLS